MQLAHHVSSIVQGGVRYPAEALPRNNPPPTPGISRIIITLREGRFVYLGAYPNGNSRWSYHARRRRGGFEQKTSAPPARFTPKRRKARKGGAA